MEEIVALEQQRRRSESRHRISHTVAEVESGRMAASFTEGAKGALGDLSMVRRKVDDGDVPPRQDSEEIAILIGGDAMLRDHGRFEPRRRADEAIIFCDDFGERRDFRLAGDDGDQG